MIWLTSDLHLNHDREFIYKPRGFESVWSMNRALIENYNDTVSYGDDVYILGDLMLGGPDRMKDGLNLLSQLKGNIHIVRGNHDTNNRWEAYQNLHNVVEVDNAIYLKYKGFHFYMSHFPTFTSNLEKETLKQCTINLYGHTHQQTNFYNDIPFMYHVGVDSHKNFPVNLDYAIVDMYAQVDKCKKQL